MQYQIECKNCAVLEKGNICMRNFCFEAKNPNLLEVHIGTLLHIVMCVGTFRRML